MSNQPPAKGSRKLATDAAPPGPSAGGSGGSGPGRRQSASAPVVARLCIQDAPGAPTRNVAEGAARVRPDDPAELASVRIDLSPTATLVPDGAVVELHLTAGSWPNLATTGHAAGDPFDGSPWPGVPATFEIVDGDLQGAWSLAG
jgi:predicted acyl esterase